MKNPRKLSEADYQRVFNGVRTDINELQLHNKVFSGVLQNLRKYPQLSINFPAFFGTFLTAMPTDFVIRLGRVFDPEGTGNESCTLARCLSTLHDNPQFFTPSAVTARLTEGYREANPNYHTFHRLDLKRIKADLDKIVKSRNLGRCLGAIICRAFSPVGSAFISANQRLRLLRSMRSFAAIPFA